MRSTGLSVAALATALLVAGCGPAAEPLEVRKTRIARLPPTWRRASIHVSADGRHATFAMRSPGGYAVVGPTGPGPTYSDVSAPLFGVTGTRVHYWATVETGGQKRVLIVVDGNTYSTDLVAPGQFAYAKDGLRWGALGYAQAIGDAPRQAVVFVDGREAGRYAAASLPAFSRDGKHVAWITRDGGGRRALVVDGAETRQFDDVAAPLPTPGPATPFERQHVVRFLDDGRLLIVTQDRDGWAVLRDGERLASYGQSAVEGGALVMAGEATTSAIMPASLVTAANAAVAFWWERLAGADERWRVVRDGIPVNGMHCASPSTIQTPVLTADGRHVAYACATAGEPAWPTGRRWVVLDGQQFGLYAEAWTLGIADDGTRVAYGAADAFPPRRWRIYANGERRTALYQVVWRPRFTPDARRVLWAAGPQEGRGALGVDGQIVTRFDDVLYGPEVADPDWMAWVIRRGRSISRLELRTTVVHPRTD